MHLFNPQLLENLQRDFTGIHVHPLGVINFLFLLLTSLTLFFYFYMIGKKVRSRFFAFTNDWGDKYFINIALGYTLICTGLAFLGFASFLYPSFIIGYLILITLFVLFPFSSFSAEISNMYQLIRGTKSWFGEQRLLKSIILLFLLFSFLRVTLPEFEADALAYHTVFPRLFLHFHTFLLSPAINIDPLAIPQLGEMPYLLTTFFHIMDASRIIHFLFFALCVLVLLSFRINKSANKFSLLLTLLFVTSPIVLQYASVTYSDYPHLFLFLLFLRLLLMKKELSSRYLVMLGLIFGGALATKFFALLYLPSIGLFLLYQLFINNELTFKNTVLKLLTFGLSALSIPLVWYLWLFSLFGSVPDSFGYSLLRPSPGFGIENSFSIYTKLNPAILTEFSSLFFLGIIGILLIIRLIREDIKQDLPIYLYLLFFGAFTLFYPSSMTSGRYFIPTYVVFGILSAKSLSILSSKFKVVQFVVLGISLLLLLRFVGSSSPLIAYGLGFADEQKLIDRQLSANDFAIFDKDKKFFRFILPGEEVLTYNTDQLFYTNFIPINIYVYLKPKAKSLSFPRDMKPSKLIMRGGDITWMCQKMKIDKCSTDNVKLIVSDKSINQYLYRIIK